MPEENIKQIARRIKELREIFDISPETLAKELGIKPGLYKNYESGSEDIPVGILSKIAHRFKVDLSTLLTGKNPKLYTYCLTRNGEGISVERREAYSYQSLAHNFAHKKAEPFLVTVPSSPNQENLSFNNHPGQEFNYVLEGTLKVVLGKYEIILNKGDSLYFDSSIDHSMQALNNQSAKFLAVVF